MTEELLAHSPRDKPPVPPQRYVDHVSAVRDRAVTNARSAARYYTGDRSAFVEDVEAAALYHDLGKLDPQNQDVLRMISRKALPIAHEDAGVEQLLRLKRTEAAVLSAAHHAGLFGAVEEQQKGKRAFRNLTVAEHVDSQIADYATAHASTGADVLGAAAQTKPLGKCGFTRRLALSCLVDADHGNTARNYAQEPNPSTPDPRWAERLEKLKRYVANLPAGTDPRQRERNALRRRMFIAGLDAPIMPAIRSCDAPVGSGKTTAVMAHLLNVAERRNLRHIIVVLPYTNIIKQSVDTYRRSLVLAGEDPEQIVAEHHHQADFSEIDTRHLATLWKAPIVVTTAVQFFETLASHHPSRLRKLHELPGSAVFVDEMHAAIPAHLWPQVWGWLETWTAQWGGHLVLASGSLPRFWELSEFVNPPKAVPDIVSEDLRHELEAAENHRLTARPLEHNRPLTLNELIRVVQDQPGPRLVIVNTVQSAAVLADAMRKRGTDVFHLSTALAPVHREVIVERIRNRLSSKAQNVNDWTLVATSCVEAGMDFSFRSGFRESCSTASLIQVGGRVSREDEHDDATVWHFRLNDAQLPPHPGFTVPQRVLESLLAAGTFQQCTPSWLTKEAMRQELTEGSRQRANEIVEAEAKMEYPTVAHKCRVIDADTRMVIIDRQLAWRIRSGEKIRQIELIRHSVQMWRSRVDHVAVEPLWPGSELYVWDDAYDPDFLGYMSGALTILKGAHEGVFLV